MSDGTGVRLRQDALITQMNLMKLCAEIKYGPKAKLWWKRKTA